MKLPRRRLAEEGDVISPNNPVAHQSNNPGKNQLTKRSESTSSTVLPQPVPVKKATMSFPPPVNNEDRVLGQHRPLEDFERDEERERGLHHQSSLDDSDTSGEETEEGKEKRRRKREQRMKVSSYATGEREKGEGSGIRKGKGQGQVLGGGAAIKTSKKNDVVTSIPIKTFSMEF